jgi:aminopeptidase
MSADCLTSSQLLVRTALKIAEGERFVVVGDDSSEELMLALEQAAKAAGAEATSLRLDILRSQATNHSGMRPHKVLPDAIRRAMLASQASAFVATAPHAEGSMREQLLHIVAACRGRHAHMPGVSTAAFTAGCSVDFAELATLGLERLKLVEVGGELVVESAAGTSLRVKVSASTRWVPRLGRVRAGSAVTFPTGSLLAHPETVHGRFVADACVGEFFGAREGALKNPVVLDIMHGTVTNVSAPGLPELEADIQRVFEVSPNSSRVGAVILGLNAGITEPLGEAQVDQHMPGLHIVVGDPNSRVTGATWSAATAFAAVGRHHDVTIGDTALVRGGAVAR